MKKKIYIALGTFALLFTALLAHIYLTQEHKIFTSKILPHDHTFEFDDHFEEVYFDVDRDAQVHALHFMVDNPKGVVLFFHGRGENLGTYWGNVAKTFTERGYDVLIPDYRQFGKSVGPRTQETLLSDALHIHSHLLDNYPSEEIIVYGCSLGTSIATYVASKQPAKMLILESPFVSLKDLAPRNAPSLFPKFLLTSILRFPLETEEWIKNVASPIHIFHGINDTIIPYDSSLRLLDIVEHGKATLTTLTDATHNSVRMQPEYHSILDGLLGKGMTP